MRVAGPAAVLLAALALSGCLGAGAPALVQLHVGTRGDGAMYISPPEPRVSAGFVRIEVVNDDLQAAYAEQRNGRGHDLRMTYYTGVGEETPLGRSCALTAQEGEPPEPRGIARFAVVDSVEAWDELCMRAGPDGRGGAYVMRCTLPGHTEHATVLVGA